MFYKLSSAMYRTKQATRVCEAGSWSPLASLRVQCIVRSKQRGSAKLARGRLWRVCDCKVTHFSWYSNFYLS